MFHVNIAKIELLNKVYQMADACEGCWMPALHFNSVELSKMMKDSVDLG